MIFPWLKTGWWYTYPSEQYELVSWDDGIPNWMESQKNDVPNHQPVFLEISHGVWTLGSSTWITKSWWSNHRSWWNSWCFFLHVLTYQQLIPYPYAPWCWNMNPNICPNKITQFCRLIYHTWTLKQLMLNSHQLTVFLGLLINQSASRFIYLVGIMAGPRHNSCGRFRWDFAAWWCFFPVTLSWLIQSRIACLLIKSIFFAFLKRQSLPVKSACCWKFHNFYPPAN